MCRSFSPPETGGADATLHYASLPIDEFEFDETQQIANVILAVARGLGHDLFIFP
jgi:hypothetical protein